jgi:hypothetical protein
VFDVPDIDRTKLPIPDPPFKGTVNKTLDGSQPDWDLIGHVNPPEGAPNVGKVKALQAALADAQEKMSVTE